MQRVGIDGLNRTETSYIKRNFDKFREDIDLRRGHEDAYAESKGSIYREHPDELHSLYENRHYEDLDLEALHKTMKKSKKPSKPETRSQRLNTNPGKRGGHGGGSYGGGGGGPRGIY